MFENEKHHIYLRLLFSHKIRSYIVRGHVPLDTQ